MISDTDQAKPLDKTTVSSSCIRIEVVNILGEKRVIEVKPYFDGKELSQIDFSLAISALEKLKDKAILAFE